jgi:cytochrome bd-type quinol oxidase subunit 2
MRHKLVSSIFIGVLATLLAGIVVDAGDRNRDVDSYDVRAERILEGIIAGKGYIMEGLRYFPLKTADTLRASATRSERFR